LSAHPNDENAANESMMPKAPTTETIAAGLSVPERILLFCLASGTDWVKAGIPTITARNLFVRNLVDHDHATRFVLTEQGRAVLAALLKPL
jgi:hypothetical protein